MSLSAAVALDTPIGHVADWWWPLLNSLLSATALAVGGYVARKLRRVDVIWQELFGVEGTEEPNGLRAEIRRHGEQLGQLQGEVARVSGNAAESPAGRAIAIEIAHLREDTMRTFGEVTRRVDRLEDRRPE